MIKKMVLIAAMGAMGVLWGSGDVTIQVINAVQEKSITHDFEKKLEKTGLAIHKVVEGGRYIVTLGSYKDEKSAKKALKKARTVACGAFIRPVNRNHIATTSHEAVKQSVVAHTGVKEAVCATAAKEEHVVVVQVKPVVVEVNDATAIMAGSSSSLEKKEAHRNEIAEAISFYKNSPYHRFEPVMLKQ